MFKSLLWLIIYNVQVIAVAHNIQCSGHAVAHNIQCSGHAVGHNIQCSGHAVAYLAYQK